MTNMRSSVFSLMLSASLVVTGGISATGAKAQQISGNSLYDACRNDDPAIAGFCIGYLIGLIEGRGIGAFQVLAQLQPGENAGQMNSLVNNFLGHCIPEDASNEQLRDVAVEYLRENPASRHETARLLIWQAYVEAFPCQ